MEDVGSHDKHCSATEEEKASVFFLPKLFILAKNCALRICTSIPSTSWVPPTEKAQVWRWIQG